MGLHLFREGELLLGRNDDTVDDGDIFATAVGVVREGRTRVLQSRLLIVEPRLPNRGGGVEGVSGRSGANVETRDADGWLQVRIHVLKSRRLLPKPLLPALVPTRDSECLFGVIEGLQRERLLCFRRLCARSEH